MGARRTDMHQLQEMLRLHRLGRGSRDIARQLRMGRDTIRRYLQALDKAGLLAGTPEELPELDSIRAIVEEHVPSKQAPQQTSSVLRWEREVAQLRAKGAQPTAIYDWLRLHEPEFDGTLSAIKRLVRRLNVERGPGPEDVAIPVLTPPGHTAQVDFGYVGLRLDPERGVLRKSWLFVMTLGCSRHMYCQIVFDQKIETWLRLHVEAFESFGGVPAVVVPDNLKAAVIRAAFGVDSDPTLNRSYRELARHYGFQVDPTPPRAPEKKGKVERGVRYVKGNFFATHETVDIHVDRKALARWMLEIAGARRHGTTGRAPLAHFEEEERAALKPLPPARWELVSWKRARLHRDSHIQVDGAFYSAPWTLLGQDLWVRCTRHSIEIHFEDRRLHTHARVARGKRSTVEEHLPEGRRDVRHRTREYWIEKARRIGPDVERLAEAIFDSDDVLYQLRKVQAVVTHLAGFPRERAQAAARHALHFGSLEYVAIKNILRKALDLEAAADVSEREWSRGSLFARKPTEILSAIQEKTHGRHR